jgi:iron complex transport system substrate-binding protein
MIPRREEAAPGAIGRVGLGLGVLFLSGSLVLSGKEPATRAGEGAVTIENCGTSLTYQGPPRRAVTMNQSATEMMLALGLQDHLVGTAYLDDAILPEFAVGYGKVPVLATGYPTRDELLRARPDFVFAAYASAFETNAAGPREDLGLPSYLSRSGCTGGNRPDRVSTETIYEEIRDIGRIFGVSARADALIARYQRDIETVRERIERIESRPNVFWYDGGDPPSAGACCGGPNEILRLAGATNIFDDRRGAWAPVPWEDVIAKNPDVIVLVDAPWSPARLKAALLKQDERLAGIAAVQRERFVTIDFSYTTPGIRMLMAVRTLADALYPEVPDSGEPRDARSAVPELVISRWLRAAWSN